MLLNLEMSAVQTIKHPQVAPKYNASSVSYAGFVKIKRASIDSVLSKDKQNEPQKGSVLQAEKQSMGAHWIQKNQEVFKKDFSNLWVILRLFMFNEWNTIKDLVEYLFNAKFIINHLFSDKALIKCDKGQLEDWIEAPEK